MGPPPQPDICAARWGSRQASRGEQVRRKPLLHKGAIVLEQVDDQGNPASVSAFPCGDEAGVRAFG